MMILWIMQIHAGAKTIHKKWSVNEAILVGDDLSGFLQVSFENQISPELGKCESVYRQVIEVCEGQALDKECETANGVSLDDYVIMIRKKTAELLASR
jgi:geranylgeranyl diphosphate synthase type II